MTEKEIWGERAPLDRLCLQPTWLDGAAEVTGKSSLPASSEAAGQKRSSLLREIQ